MSDTFESDTESETVIYQLLHADDYWSSLCSIKYLDRELSSLEEDEIVGKQPQTTVAMSLLNLLNDFEERRFSEVCDDYKTALPSGAPNQIQTINTNEVTN